MPLSKFMLVEVWVPSSNVGRNKVSRGWSPELGLRKPTLNWDLVAPPSDIIPDHTAQIMGWDGLYPRETLWAGCEVLLKGGDVRIFGQAGTRSVLDEK